MTERKAINRALEKFPEYAWDMGFVFAEDSDFYVVLCTNVEKICLVCPTRTELWGRLIGLDNSTTR